jgi:hypothetical protein
LWHGAPLVGVWLGGSSGAWAAPDDQAVTSLGTQLVYTQGLGRFDVDPLVGERLRWTVGPDARLLADARFTLDPAAADVWEQQRVRTLGVELGSGAWIVAVGRHPVAYGGPRIVDGLQVLHRPAGSALTIGAWGGLAPDLFTTRPMLRPGGGPVIAWDLPAVQASLVGEVVGVPTGLDRVALLTLVRVAPGAAVDVSGRLDAQLAPGGGGLALADGALFGRWRPAPTVRLDALFDAYSSARYLESASLDPDLRRYAARVQALALADGITAELPDASLYELVGAGAAWQGRSDLAPRVALTGRYRHHATVASRYATIAPQVGLFGLAGGRLDATLDGSVIWHGDAGVREELGLGWVVDPTGDGRVTFDASGRWITDPGFDGKPGWYADLFVSCLGAGPLVLVAGASVTYEPSVVPDAGAAGFVWLQHRVERHEPAGATRLP